MNVPPTCFYPEPGVVSSVLRIVMRRGSSAAGGGVALLDDGPGGLRPEKKNPLEQPPRCRFCRRHGLSRCSRRRGIEGVRRAETLSVEEFGLLAAGLAATGDAGKILDKRRGI